MLFRLPSRRFHRGSAGAAGAVAARAFSLAELLVVVGIIAVLTGLLMPTLSRARESARMAVCQSNLRQIHAAVMMYAQDNLDRWPDTYTMGTWGFRMRPGMRSPGDPGALPEVYGLPAVLHGIRWEDDLSAGVTMPPKYLDCRSEVWICPSAIDWMKEYGNTYAHPFSGRLDPTKPASYKNSTPARIKWANDIFLWDNYSMYPGLSGFRGTFSGYTITSGRPYPHGAARINGTTKVGKGSACQLHVGGHITLLVSD